MFKTLRICKQQGFIVGAVFVMISVVFIGMNAKHVKHVDHVQSGH